MKILSVVLDRKSGDLLAPQFVPSTASCVRNFIAMSQDDPKSLFCRFPEDYSLLFFDVVVREDDDDPLTQSFYFSFKEYIDFDSFIEKKGECDGK